VFSYIKRYKMVMDSTEQQQESKRDCSQKPVSWKRLEKESVDTTFKIKTGKRTG